MSHYIDESISALGSLIPIRKEPNVNRLASSFGVWFVYAFYFQKYPYCSLDSSKSVSHSLEQDFALIQAVLHDVSLHLVFRRYLEIYSLESNMEERYRRYASNSSDFLTSAGVGGSKLTGAKSLSRMSIAPTTVERFPCIHFLGSPFVGRIVEHRGFLVSTVLFFLDFLSQDGQETT